MANRWLFQFHSCEDHIIIQAPTSREANKYINVGEFVELSDLFLGKKDGFYQ